jgi:hypothetical protein
MMSNASKEYKCNVKAISNGIRKRAIALVEAELAESMLRPLVSEATTILMAKSILFCK